MRLNTHVIAQTHEQMRELTFTRLLEQTSFDFADYARQLHDGESLAFWGQWGRSMLLIRIDNPTDFDEIDANYLRQTKPEKWGYYAVRPRR